MNTVNSSTAIKFLYCFVFILITSISKSQIVYLISNPNGYFVYPASRDKDFPVIYDGNLMVSEMNSSYIPQLAKYDGIKITLIENPDNSRPNFDDDATYPQTIIYNNKLYLTFLYNTSIYQLAQYDNDSVKLITTPDGYRFDPYGGFAVYKGKLYMQYINSATLENQLAVFDGKKISVIKNPDKMGSILSPSPFVVYSDKLYFYYAPNNVNVSAQLCSYDGTNFQVIPNPTGVSKAAGSLIIYNNNLYFQGQSSKMVLMKYDGNAVEALPNPGNGSIGDLQANNLYHYPWTPFVDSAHDQLCFQYTDLDSFKVHLCSYNDTIENVIPNPTSSGIGKSSPEIYPINFQNNAYVQYQSNLALYDGKNLTILPNPNNYPSYHGPSIVFGKNLYSQFGELVMGKFDGTSISVVTGTRDYLNYPIIYNNKLFGYYYDTSKKMNELGYLDTSSVLSTTLFGLTGQFQNHTCVLYWPAENNGNSSYFNIQRSADAVNFITINKMPVNTNTNSLNAYTYTDEAADSLSVTKLYYRLQEVDINGTISYSNIVSVNILKPQKLFSVLPNPIKNFIQIMASENVGNTLIRISDMQGKILYSAKEDFIATQPFKIVTTQFPAEILLVTIIKDKHFENFKIVKEY